MKELKPCPFCGGEAYLEDARTIWVVRCNKCGVSVLGERAPEPETKKQADSIDWEYYLNTAIKAWNTREDNK